MTIGEKIAQARRYAQPALSQEELGNAIGVSRATVANFETGRTQVRPDMVAAIAAATGIDPDWFADPRPTKPSVVRENEAVFGLAPGAAPPNPLGSRAPVAGGGRRLFPLVGRVGAALIPVESDGEWSEDYIEFSDDLFDPTRYAVQVRGDSQSPLIRSKDYVLVHPCEDTPVGLFGVFGDEESHHVIKLLKYDSDGRPALHSINPDYPPMSVPDTWTKVGYVVAVRRERGPGRYFELGDNDGLSPRSWED